MSAERPDTVRPPMTEDHVRGLLSLLVALDSRMRAPDEHTADLRVRAWATLLAPVNPEFALTFAETHYSEPQDWPLQPAHILRAWKDHQAATANADDEKTAMDREVRERRCVWWRICACDHTVCRAGWLDEETEITNAHGTKYAAVKRCPHCKDAILMAEEQGLIKKPPTPKRRGSWSR